MTLALLLTAVTGAWAQSSLKVVEFKAPANWEGDNNPVTAADLPGFKASTLEEARAWKGAPTEGMAMLFYAFEGDNAYHVYFNNGEPISDSHSPFEKNILFGYSKLIQLYYTAEPTEWSLTPDETGKTWTLAKMPASNVELQVEYFAESNLFLGKEALADKANIAVKAGDLGVEFGNDGKSANTVTEGTPMTVKFNGTKKVLGMKVEKKAAEPVADIIWDVTNVSNLQVRGDYLSYEKEGVKLSGNANNMEVTWVNFENPTTDGISFIANESGGFTFTAPTGKAFTKIEMKALGSYGWAQENLGTGWAYFGDDTNKIYKVTWTGSAASTVKLLTGTDNFFGDYISSIAFYLSE